MERPALAALALMALIPIAFIAAAALLLAPHPNPNRGWGIDLKPGATITLEEIEKLGESG